MSYDPSNINNEMIDAAKMNNPTLLKCLLQNGADINAKDSDGISALIYAAAYGNLEIIKYLVVKGADINVANSDGQTVLIFASGSAYTNAILGSEEHAKLVKYLINKGKLIL